MDQWMIGAVDDAVEDAQQAVADGGWRPKKRNSNPKKRSLVAAAILRVPRTDLVPLRWKVHGCLPSQVINIPRDFMMWI